MQMNSIIWVLKGQAQTTLLQMMTSLLVTQARACAPHLPRRRPTCLVPCPSYLFKLDTSSQQSSQGDVARSGANFILPKVIKASGCFPRVHFLKSGGLDAHPAPSAPTEQLGGGTPALAGVPPHPGVSCIPGSISRTGGPSLAHRGNNVHLAPRPHAAGSGMSRGQRLGCHWGVPKTIFGFRDSLEGGTDLRKATVLTVMVYGRRLTSTDGSCLSLWSRVDSLYFSQL